MKFIASLFLLYSCCLVTWGSAPGVIPVIDGGALSEGLFASLPWREGAWVLGKNVEAAPGMRFKIAHDRRNLYVAVEIDEPQMDRMRRKNYSNGSPLLWNNDSIEVNIVPDAGLKSFYKLMIDANGKFAAIKMVDDNTDRDQFRAFPWHVSPEVKVRAKKNQYQLLVAIPLGSMSFTEGLVSDLWRFNIGRNRYASGKVEYSATSRIPVVNHVYPKSFSSWRLQNFDLARYKATLGKPDVRFAKTAQGFKVDVTADVFNHTGGYCRFMLAGSILDANGKVLASAKSPAAVQNGLFRNSALQMTTATGGACTLLLELYSSGRTPALITSERIGLHLEYVPLKVRLTKPAYRDNLYATMPDKSIEGFMVLEEKTGSTLLVELLNESGKVLASHKVAAAKGSEKFRFDGASLPDGRYTLRATGPDGMKAQKVIRKLPYRKGEVWLDRSGVVHVDGKKILPFGWYGGIPERPKKWNNGSYTWGQGITPQTLRKHLAKSAEMGIYTYVMPWQGTAAKTLLKEPDMRKNGTLSEAQKNHLRTFMAELVPGEGLLGWYMADEPEGRDNNPKWYEDAYELLREIDPYHPCIMLNWGMDGMARFFKSSDILMPDCYLQYFEDGSTGKPLWSNGDYAKFSTSLRPSLHMPLMTVWPSLSSDRKKRGVPPNYDQQRSQFFQALIHNVKGFSMYAYFDSQIYSPLIVGPDRIGETLHILKDLMLADTRANALDVTTSPRAEHFQSGVKVDEQDKICVIAVETDSRKTAASFRLKNLKKMPDRLYVAGENRSVEVKNGTFRDSFNPGETHLYLCDEKLAAAVPSVEGTRREIAKLTADRRRPGNIAATGELFAIDYTNIGKGEIPANMPRVRASSDSRFYGTLETGSLYFLLDGLRNPNREENTWSPHSSDKAPFVEVVLPKSAVICKVVLFTPGGNLRSGKVLVGGKSVPFDNVAGKNEITVAIPSVAADTVRIECEKKVRKSSSGVEARLLSEIEIY